jgi:phosphoribosylglycinamide formyltransferase-1
MNKKEKQEKKIEAIEYIMYYDASLSEYPQYANDREVAMIAVKKSGYNIKYVSKELKNDKEIVLIATKTNSGTLCNISDELRGDPDVIKSILKNKPIAFQDLYKKDQSNIDYIVLAGFLLLVPAYLVSAFPQRIFNIHPALLPKHGGKGMYGHFVHEAVKAAGDTESGMTIHWVDEHYDEGTILFQARCTLAPEDTPEDIARKVLELEHRYYAEVIEKTITEMA